MIDEKLLWTAVLEQAVIDLRGANECEARERPRLRYFAELWINSDPQK
jgi:hypothetical protein